MKIARARAVRSLALAIFVAGFIVAPAFHLAFHDLPHRHDGDPVARHVHPHVHPHPHPHTHPHAAEAQHDRDTPPAREPFNPHHGRNSLAHFSAGGSSHIESLPDLGCIALVVVGFLAPHEPALPHTASRLAHSVRGPPTHPTS